MGELIKKAPLSYFFAIFVQVVMLVMLSMIPASSVASAASVPLRGVIEGFYGTPWTEAARLDMLAFCGKSGLNAYIYAPKDDPYHREKWREPYPEAELADLARLVTAAKADGVRFIFAVSPGLDLHLGAGEAADRAAMLEKCEALYALGVRDFAIFFDDIESCDGAGQAAFLRAIDQELRARHPDVHPFLTVPTQYSYDTMQDGAGNSSDYTRAFAAGLAGTDILVLYTGDGVARGGLTADSLAAARNLYGGRPLGPWWNYPVTDYDEAKLALGPIEQLPLGDVPAIFYNPMKHERLSKIALATGAALAKDPETYNPEAAWHQAIEDFADTENHRTAAKRRTPSAATQPRASKAPARLAAAMETFADHSTHMKNIWADIGRPDAPAFRHAVDNLFAAIDQGAPEAVTTSRLHDLDARLSAIEQDASILETNLDPATLAECQPQLHRLKALATACRTGLRLLEVPNDKAARTDFHAARAALAKDTAAHISDDALQILLDGITERAGE